MREWRRFSLRQRLTAGFASAVLVLVVGIISYGSVRAAEGATAQVEHTRAVTDRLDAVLSHLQDAEMGQRGYLLTGDARYLTPYHDGVRNVSNDLGALRGLMRDNPDQTVQLGRLEPLVQQMLSELSLTIVLRDGPGGLPAALTVVRSDRGVHTMGAIRGVITGLREGEQQVLEDREARAATMRRVATGVIVGGSFLAFVLAALANRAIRRAVMDREAQREQVERQAALLDAQRAELARSNRELDQFAYVASHDLKAPLRGIANLSRWIEEDLGDALTGEAREQMSLLRDRVRRMERLIDGILEYSRAGRLQAQPEPVDVGALLTDTIELLAPPDTTTVAIGDGMPTIVTERVQLQQVFMNLIANAVRYAQRPDARVTVTARPAGDGYEFAVADNGPGIAPQYHDRVFGIFQTLEAREDARGTGIGLSVVKKLVEARGGRVWVESEPGHGATFRFTWDGERTTNEGSMDATTSHDAVPDQPAARQARDGSSLVARP